MVRLCFGRQIHDGLSLGDARRFSYESLQLATYNFCDDMLLGEGGCARVYRGVLPNGTVIAVKIYKVPTGSARIAHYRNRKMFFRMVEIISSIQHPNIHQVIGYCIHKSHVLLVSEYADNGSLHDLLHNQQQKRFSWPMRAAVCRGIARGLTHLHENVTPRAVHCDIKPANVLLDANFTPKISDFDLVSFFPSHIDELRLKVEAVDTMSGHFYYDTHISTGVRGTTGYFDPEYYISCRVTQMSDVYSFGVTLLETISGRKVVDVSRDKYNVYISKWALNLLRDDRVLEIVDPVLTDFPTDEVRHFLDMAFSCIKKRARERPTMREVTQMLEGTSNVFGRQLLAPNSPHYYSAASSFRSSISQTNDEGGGETEPAVS